MSQKLKNTTINALIWSGIEKFSLQAIGFISTIIVARLLTPADFGLVAMITVFIAVSNVFIDSGFGTAIIQKKNLTNEDCSTVFFFNLFIAVLLYLVLFFCAPFIADFYKQPALINLTRVLGLVLVFNSLGLIQISLIQKEIKFKTNTKINLFAIIISSTTGITCALLGFGVWSLVIQQVCLSLSKTILLWLFNSWRPVFVFSKSSFSHLFRFSSGLLVSEILETFFQNIYYIIIGRFFPASELGFFTQAKKLNDVSVTTLTSVVTQVAFPVFSTIHDDLAKLKSAFRKNIRFISFLVLPLSFCLMAVSHSLILTLLKEKWLPSAPLLQILCIMGIFYTLDVSNMVLLKSKGKSALYLKLEIAKKIIAVVAILIGIRWGIFGLAWSSAATLFAGYLLDTITIGPLIHYPINEQLKDILPSFTAAGVMGICVYFIGTSLQLPSLIVLCIQVIAAIALYLLFVWILKMEELNEIRSLAAKKFFEKKVRLS
ncbi:MAG: lipopolysaccharide biosynthesis protein [Bacteroidetes bacterium]|nr:lipopolysaccharide biosynthesis protein [Bacteroidota bacterium]